MLSMLCAGQPHTVLDVEDRVQKKIPHPIDRWATSDAQAAIEKEKKNKKTLNLVLPVDKLHQTLIKVIVPYHIVTGLPTHSVGDRLVMFADVCRRRL